MESINFAKEYFQKYLQEVRLYFYEYTFYKTILL